MVYKTTLELNMSHIRAVRVYLNSRNNNNKYNYVKYLSHTIHYQIVSIAVATIIRETYKKLGIRTICQNVYVIHSMLQRMF